MKKLLYAALFVLSASSYSQTQLAFTSFEEPNTGSQYTDTGDPNVPHDLLNNPGEAEVDFSASPTEIGFNARYVPYNTPGVGLTDGDFVGTTDFTGDVGTFPNGTKGYQFSDTDGNMILEFDLVDFDGYENNSVSIDYFLNQTGYEGDGTINESGFDRIRIYLNDITNSSEIDLLNTEGSDINDLNIEGGWNNLNVTIPDNAQVQLIVEVRTNSGAEGLYIDNVSFEGTQTAPDFVLEITEIFSGQAGADLTADWFEIHNTGAADWVSGTDPDLFYDDESADATTADIVQGLSVIPAGGYAIVLITGNPSEVNEFTGVWGAVIDLTGVEVGFTNGAGLGGGGDAVNLWLGDPLASMPFETASYPGTAANDGQSFDVDLGEFSTVGNANNAVETIAQGGSSGDVPNIGSPGNGPAVTLLFTNFENSFASVSEDGGSITISVAPSAAPTVNASVNVALRSEGTAQVGVDFTYATNATINFPAGSTDAQQLSIPIINNSQDNSDLFFVLELINPTDIVVGSNHLFSAYILDDDTNVPASNDTELNINYLTSFLVDENGTAEISAYDPDNQQVFVVNDDKLEVLDFSDLENIQSLATINVSDFGGASIQSVAFKNGLLAVAVAVNPETDNGFVVITNAFGDSPVSLEVGVLPDMLTFSPDGNLLVVANEGQPSEDYNIDPEGSVSVIDISGGFGNITQSDVTTLNFNAFDSQQASLQVAGVRIYGPGASVSQDLEPEYVTISNNSETAYVTLQENNAYAVVDLVNLEITEVRSFGLKDHSLPQNSLDVSDETDFIFNASWPIKGMYMPDAIAYYEVDGTGYIVTANEGDSREYDAFDEEIKIDDAAYTLAPGVFNNIEILELESNLSEINVSNASGDIDNDGFYEEIHVFGGRSFSIFNAETGALVYDSGNDFEVITANDPVYGSIFNASNSNNNFKNRSDNKGPEPEGVIVQEINGEFYAFVLLERIGGMMVYNVSNPNAPVFLEYENSRDATPGANEAGDLGPEGVFYVSPQESPNEKGLIVISNEVSATLSIYTIENDVLSTTDFDATLSNGFSMYPNPADDIVFFNKVGAYVIYDLSGRMITQKDNAASMDISALKTGVYIIKNENGFSQKLIVE